MAKGQSRGRGRLPGSPRPKTRRLTTVRVRRPPTTVPVPTTTSRKGLFDRIATSISAATAILALLLSVINWVQLNKRPDLTMTMPRLIRIVHSPRGAEIIVQLTFTVHRKAELSSAVSWARIAVTSAAGSASPGREFPWLETGSFLVDDSDRIVYQYLGDPAPFVVTQDEPQIPYMVFRSKQLLSAGRWNARVIVERPDQTDLTGDLCFELDTADLADLTRAPNQYFIFQSNDAIGCYSRI